MIRVLSSSGFGLTDAERAEIDQRGKLVNWIMLAGMAAAVVYLVRRPTQR